MIRRTPSSASFAARNELTGEVGPGTQVTGNATNQELTGGLELYVVISP